jgi:glycosyltransferase involved in cell wall biosynthesis
MGSEMKQLSVIVPVYNVEPYVERCIRSLADQDIPAEEYEIIVINDGSPDNSREVVIRLQKEFNNLILIDQENQRVSRARNNGIEKATGGFLLFIDPDDYVDPMSFGRILKNAKEKNAQVSFLGFTLLNEDWTVRKRVFNEVNSERIYPGTEAYFVSRGDGSSDPDRMWAVLYKTGFIKSNELLYLPGVPYLEDGELIARIMCLAERCIFDGESFYQRTIRQGSATNSNMFFSEKANKGFFMAASNLRKFQQNKILSDSQFKFLNQPICKFVVLVVSSSVSPFRFRKLAEVKKRLRNEGLGKVDLDSVNREFTLLGKLYNRSLLLLVIWQFFVNRTRFLKSYFRGRQPAEVILNS